ncbi:MAG: choice-of-anchor L domain-containing protein [Ignavibacteria bacterium]|nr:choice-of-anchor L domain-containing protein [Ignavibacteria bacterium]
MTAFAIRFRSGIRCALLLCALAAGAGPEARAQLRIDSSFTPTALVKRFFEGGCAEIRNVRYRGAKGALGLFDGSNTNIGMDLGILMTTGDLRSAVGPNDLDSAGRANGYIYGDFQLDSLVKGRTYEAAVLDFDFTSFIDTISFEYVFGSEEYPEFVGSKYNDVFAFFVTDTSTGITRNIALIPGTPTPVSINNVNDWVYWQHYINNNNGPTIQYDGFTRVLRAKLAVTPCSTYHMKIAIADVADDIYDSGVFLKAGSFNAGSRVSIETIRDAYEGGCVPGIFRFRRSGETVAPLTITYRIGGSATDSVDFERFSTQLTFPVGVDSVDVFVRARTDSVADAGETVSVAFDNTCACAATTSVMTIREAPPLRLFTSGDTTCCLGGTATLRAYAEGGSGSRAWQWNPGPGIDSVLAYQPLSTRRVDVTVTDLLTGCVLRDSILVTVLAPPEVDAGPDIVVCHQKGVTIGNPAQGGPEPYIYQWSPAVGLSNARVAQPVARPALTTMYTVTVTSAIGCVTTDSVLVRASNVNFGLGKTRVICPGESALIGGAASGGTEPYSYAWTPAEGLDDSTARYAVAAPVRSTLYTLEVRDALGCVYRDSVLVSVRDVPPLRIEPAGPVTICDGRPLVLRASAGFVSYAWSAGGNTDSMVVVTGGTYRVTVTDSNGCRAQDSVSVQYHTAPSPSVRALGPDRHLRWRQCAAGRRTRFAPLHVVDWRQHARHHGAEYGFVLGDGHRFRGLHGQFCTGGGACDQSAATGDCGRTGRVHGIDRFLFRDGRFRRRRWNGP